MVNKKDRIIQYSFKSIHYDNEILKWIEIVKKEVANLTNLALVLEQYEEIILKLYNQYTQKAMTLIKFIEKQGDTERKEMLQMIQEINKQFPSLREDLIKDFLTKSAEKINKKLPNDWQADFEDDEINQRYSKPLTIHKRNKEEKYYFSVEFGNTKMYRPYVGIVGSYKEIKDDDEIIKLLKKAQEGYELKGKNEDWWIAWKSYKDFFQLISEKGVEKASDDFVADFYKIFETYKEVVIKCNEYHQSTKTTP